MSWRKLPISLKELCIDTTLRCGQSFRWKKLSDDTYNCAIHGRLISLRQDSTNLHYRAIFPSSNNCSVPLTPDTDGGAAIDFEGANEQEDEETKAFLQHYLNLGPNLSTLYAQWSSADANFKKKAPKFTGVRILRQDAWEALVGFICSSNNNIPRISQMMEKLCVHYGPLIGHIDTMAFYDMPSPDALTGPEVEAHLRQLGFGYRAKYIYKTAVMIVEEKKGWLDSLRNPESPLLGGQPKSAGELLDGGREGYRHAHEQLLALQGVGPKVADCVCLMGLGWGEAVPVDTHVWNIACRDYKFGKGKHSSLTKHVYGAIGDHFRKLWGKEAGWAHSVLFTADLRAFSERLYAQIEVKEDAVKEEGEYFVEQEGVVEGDIARAIPASEDEDGELPLVKAERIVSMAVENKDQQVLKIEDYESKDERKSEVEETRVETKQSGAGIKSERTQFKNEDTEMPSIEHDDEAIKAEHGEAGVLSCRANAKFESQTPIKQERSTSKHTPKTRDRSLTSRAIKAESRTPTKQGIQDAQPDTPNTVSGSASTMTEAGNASIKQESLLKTATYDMLSTETLLALGVKREAEQGEQNQGGRGIPLPRRKSKRQRRG